MKKSFLVLFTSFIVSFIAFYIIVKQDFKLAFIVALLLAIAITITIWLLRKFLIWFIIIYSFVFIFIAFFTKTDYSEAFALSLPFAMLISIFLSLFELSTFSFTAQPVRDYFVKEGKKLNVIIIDIETTGLSHLDEILQLSIINENGSVIFNKYFKPQDKTSWDEAQKIHNISPRFVNYELPIENYKTELENIFNNADVIMGYNLEFDLKFIKRSINFKKPLIYIDVMQLFTNFYYENSSILPNVNCGYKYKKLSFAAHFFKYPKSTDEYNFQGSHGSLEDARATLYVFKKLEQSLQTN
ncbi:hypothetical protein B7A30_04915, partial [Campylobacter coli]|nr:hypothetical protein [Campylobacter coli]